MEAELESPTRGSPTRGRAARARDNQGYLRQLLQPRVDELVRSLEDAEKIPEKFHHDFDRHSLGDELK